MKDKAPKITKVYNSPIHCKFCSKEFSSKTSTIRHEKHVCRFRIKVYSCDWCDTTFSRRIDLEYHLKTIDCFSDPLFKFSSFFSLNANINVYSDITNSFFNELIHDKNAPVNRFHTDTINNILYGSADELDLMAIDWPINATTSATSATMSTTSSATSNASMSATLSATSSATFLA